MKSKIYKYKVEQSKSEYQPWKIKMKKRGLFSFMLHWIPVHATFKTKEEAEAEVKMYIKDDNAHYKK